MIRALSTHICITGQTHEKQASLYADDVNALSFHPNGRADDCIHTWLNKWRMQGNFTKSKVMVFHPKEGDARAVLNTGH
jgi:hypothetical protein